MELVAKLVGGGDVFARPGIARAAVKSVPNSIVN